MAYFDTTKRRATSERGISRAPEKRGPLGAGGMDPQQSIRAALMAYDQLQRAKDQVSSSGEAGSRFRQTIDQTRLRKAEEAYKQALGKGPAAAGTKPKAKPTTPAPTPAPVVTVPEPGQPGNTPVPALPIDTPTAVTNPISQISPEEEAARLRARLLLMGNGTRAGRLGSGGAGFLGARSLGAM